MSGGKNYSVFFKKKSSATIAIRLSKKKRPNPWPEKTEKSIFSLIRPHVLTYTQDEDQWKMPPSKWWLILNLNFPIFESYMQIEKLLKVAVTSHDLLSEFLKRKVKIDLYFPPGKMGAEELNLLLINDGQDLPRMDFKNILGELYEAKEIKSILSVGIHCGEDRRNEYGTANVLNYKGQGAKAAAYTRFIFEELLPFIRSEYKILSFREKSFCGFSLGGLSAMDIVWHHAEEFSAVAAFSGSFWWRTLSQDDPEFEEAAHMIMQNEVKNGKFYPWLKFFFETGALDETADRNKNGIIDSIDDTLSLIDELIKKGYRPGQDIRYLELKDGTHDVATWGRAFPEFLKWI